MSNEIHDVPGSNGRKGFYLDTSGPRTINLWIFTDCGNSQSEAARKLGLTVGTVNSWIQMRKRIPLKHAFKIEELSGGKYKAAVLRG